jgi:hypothetical protein
MEQLYIPESVLMVDSLAFLHTTELARKAKEAGMTIEEWGRMRYNRTEIRFAFVFALWKLQKLNDTQMMRHIARIPKPAFMRRCVLFLCELGEPGLVREIVKYIA